ncbi:hypothetical protein [Haematobacter genomosp. 1]|uniref:Uncharacterized protein n=1 Tax=Haematobacter genomosp. 1 TaxID=366618 RepID=A0A212ACG5_9RHOB|nr:hypothetical protein [Haematobacter genomosp. 1]OWJ78582.1 hypothetical protein CDV49_09200 [Haematobacter genomosp. 1]
MSDEDYGYYGVSEMDLWRLADCFSVINAATLIAGLWPGERGYDEQYDSYFFRPDRTGEKLSRFSAVLQSMKASILSNKLEARMAFPSRIRNGSEDTGSYQSDELHIPQLPLLLCIENGGKLMAAVNGQWKIDSEIFVRSTPDWDETYVETDELKRWLKARGVFPPFFFPQGDENGIMNADNPRYSAKLACALAAWKDVASPRKGKSVKQSLKDWVISNGVRFGLGEDGVVSETAAEEIAKIANWNLKGGATPTMVCDTPGGGSGVVLPKEPQNYTTICSDRTENQSSQDEDFPF